MTLYKKRLTIQEPNRIVLSDVPFQQGQEVEVVLRAIPECAADLENLKPLFKKTQALPQVQILTEDEIAAEIEAYRARR